MSVLPNRAKSRLSKHIFLAGSALATSLFTASVALAQQQQQPQQPEPAEPAPSDVEEIVVRGQFVPQEKRDTSEISNILDFEDLERTGDDNIAVSLQRLTGLSLVDNQFVFVRGLGERYSSVLVNGANIPSPQPLQRIIPLNIFPNNILSGALVQKTYSSQYGLDFGGGVVNLRTRKVPEERFFSVQGSISGDTASTFEDGLTYDGGDFDWLGTDFGFRALPSVLDQDFANLSPQQLEDNAEELPNLWSLDEQTNPVNVTLGGSYGDSWNIYNGWRLGVILTTQYQSNWRQRDGQRNTFITSDVGLLPNNEIRPDVCESFEGAEGCGLRSTEWTVSLNTMLQLGLEFNENNTLSYTTMLLRNSVKEGIIQQGLFAEDPDDLRQDVRLDFVERQVWSNIVSGEHFVDVAPGLGVLEPMEIDWLVNVSSADRDAPLRRNYFYFYDQARDRFELSARPDANETSFNELDDRTVEGGADLSLPVNFEQFSITFNGGFNWLDLQRVSSEQLFSYEFPAGGNTELLAFIPELVYSPVNVFPDGGFELEDRTDPSDAFSADGRITSGYGSFEAQVTPTFRFSAGFRYEDSEQVVRSVARGATFIDNELVASRGEEITTTLEGEYLLPSVTATWEFLPNMQIRGGFSQTIARPTLRELSPARFLEQERDITVVGNPALEIAEFDNFDLRWEYYFGQNQFVTLGAFYKEIEKPIEQTVQSFGEGFERSFINADDAELYGAEFEIEADLPVNRFFENDWFKRKRYFGSFNFTYVDSEVTIAQEDAGIVTNLDRRLQGQSNILANFELGFEDFEARDRFSILFNFTGDRIEDVGIQGAPDVVEDQNVRLDLIYAKEFDLIGGTWEFSVEARNLTNDDQLLTQGGRTVENFDLGRSFSLGLQTQF